jgi:hypothetical protein
VFLIALRSITTEAQGALLKLFEDPAPGALFLLVTPPGTFLLPTLLSRFSAHVFNPSSSTGTLAASFFSDLLPERMSKVADIVEEKDKKKATDFLNSLEVYAHGVTDQASLEVYEALVTSRSYLSTRSPSVKMILEYLALTLPKK